ncbi:MAG TPA: PEP-CTERM sorting domain-containing protein [Caulobacteraceae bacterium]
MAAVSTLFAGAASASVLYGNGPPSGKIDGWLINPGFAVSDSFTLTSAATITGVTFGVWTSPGDSISAIDWGIADAPGVYTDTATATVTSGTGTENLYEFDVGVDSFSITPTTLAAGTYYLVLQNASVTNGDLAGWDVNNGPSTATTLTGGAVASESFQILGSSVPEPSSWGLMMAGVFGVGAALRRRRNATAVAA